MAIVGAVVGVGLVTFWGCRDAEGPPAIPEARCIKTCQRRATQCSVAGCRRGCSLALDRLVERQGAKVVGCVAARKPACDDPTWARCAVLFGAHEDGGPPLPPPPGDWNDEESPAASPPNSKSDDDLDP